MVTATLNGERRQTISDVEVAEEEKPKKGNPMLRKLEPEMIRNPYPIDFANGKAMDSDQLCYQRAASFIFEPLGFRTEKECIEFAKGVWRWIGAAEERREEELALAEDRRQEELAEVLFIRAQKNPKILEKLKAKLDAV